MSHFPSLHRPVEHVEGLPGAISAGAVSNVQLFDLTAKVMRTVVIMASTDGGVYVMGGMGPGPFQRRGGRQDSATLPRHTATPSDVSHVVDVPVGSALLISADTTCGAVTQHLSSKVASPSSPSPSAAGLGDRPWRIQSLVAYRTSYNEAAVIIVRVPSPHSASASNSPPAEHCSELLFFYTQPLHSLSFFREARGGSESSADSSTSKSALAARVVRPKEHVMRLFALHVEPSPTGNRLTAPYNSNPQAHSEIKGKGEVSTAEEKARRDELASLGSLRYAHQSPPGLVVLCSSVVLCAPSKNNAASPSHMSPHQSGHTHINETNSSQQTVRNQLSVLCLPMSAAERFKAADLVKPLCTDATTSADSLSGVSGEGASQNKKKMHDSTSESAGGSCLAVGQGHRIVPLWLEIARFLREEEEMRGTGCGPVCSIAVTCTSPPEPRASPSSVGWMVALGCVDGTVVLASCPPCTTGSSLSEAKKSFYSYPIQVVARLTGPASWLQFFLNSGGWEGQHGGGGAEGSSSAAAPRGTRSPTIDKYLLKEVHTADYASHGHNFTYAPAQVNVGLFSPQLSLLGLDISGRALQWTRLTPLQQASSTDEASACVEGSTTNNDTTNDFNSSIVAHHNAYSPKMQYVWDAIEVDEMENGEQLPTAARGANDKFKNNDSNLDCRESSEGRPASIIDNANTPAVSATLLPHPQDSSLPPAETPEKKRKDKSLVERWLNRKAGGGGGGVSTSNNANNTSSALVASRQQQNQHQQHSASSIGFNTNNSTNHLLGSAGNGRIRNSSSGGGVGGRSLASVGCSQVDLCALDGSVSVVSHTQQMRCDELSGGGGGSTLSGGAALDVCAGEDGGGKGGGDSSLAGTCTRRRPCFEEATHMSRRSGNTSHHNKNSHLATHAASLGNNKKLLKVLVDSEEEDLMSSLYRVGTIIGRGPLAAAFVDHVNLSSHLYPDDSFFENDEEDDDRTCMCIVDSEDCGNSSSQREQPQRQRTIAERTTSKKATSRGPQVLISTLGRVVAVCAPYATPKTVGGNGGRSAEILHASAYGGGVGVGTSFPAAALPTKCNGNASSSSSPLSSNPHQHSRSRTELPSGGGSPNESAAFCTTKQPFEVLGGSGAVSTVSTILPAQLRAQASGSAVTTEKKRGFGSKLLKSELNDGMVQECDEAKRTPSPSPSPTPALDASATPVLVAEGGIGLPDSVEAPDMASRTPPPAARSPTTSFFASPPPLPAPMQRKTATDDRQCFDEQGGGQVMPHETCSPLFGTTPPRSMKERVAEQQTPVPLAVVDYFDVFSPMSYLGLADFSGVGDSVLVMASCDHVAVMPLHRRPNSSELARRVSILKSLFGIGQTKQR